jgi:hypothetical protein
MDGSKVTHVISAYRANPVSKFGSLTYNRWPCHATWNHMTILMVHTAICRWWENTDHVPYHTNFGCLSQKTWQGLIGDTHKPVSLSQWLRSVEEMCRFYPTTTRKDDCLDVVKSTSRCFDQGTISDTNHKNAYCINKHWTVSRLLPELLPKIFQVHSRHCMTPHRCAPSLH